MSESAEERYTEYCEDCVKWDIGDPCSFEEYLKSEVEIERLAKIMEQVFSERDSGGK